MTILIIALTIISFNLSAQFKAVVTPSKQGMAGYSVKADTKDGLDKELLRLTKKSSWMKGEWNDKEEGSILKKSEMVNEMKDTGETEIITDDEGNETEAPVMEVVEVEKFSYYHPSNFSLAVKDITIEEQEKLNKLAERKAKILKIKEAKGNLNKKSGESVAEWRTRISETLDILIEELKE